VNKDCGNIAEALPNFRPSVLNRICARPVILSLILGECILGAVVLLLSLYGMPFSSIASESRGLLILAIATIGVAALGFIFGMLICWPWIRPICSKINGAPLQVGDRVVVLAGALQGTVTEVEGITCGQGGWNIVLLDLGPERERTFTNAFEEYSLFKIAKRAPFTESKNH